MVPLPVGVHKEKQILWGGGKGGFRKLKTVEHIVSIQYNLVNWNGGAG
jgi:hypothetical protein